MLLENERKKTTEFNDDGIFRTFDNNRKVWFNAFWNSLEIYRYFKMQTSEIIKSFGIKTMIIYFNLEMKTHDNVMPVRLHLLSVQSNLSNQMTTI